MLGSALANDCAHVRRVGGIGPAVVALGAEGLVGHITGEVVVIACVMVARRLSAIGD